MSQPATKKKTGARETAAKKKVKATPKRALAVKKTVAKKIAAKKTAAPTRTANRDDAVQGVPLIERVIALVEKKGLNVLGTCGLPRNQNPVPVPADVLDRLTFPNGAPLSPSLKRWLAFDAAWLGWFADPKKPVLQPKKIGAYALDEYGMDWGYGVLEKKLLPGDCFGLHFGSDSRRFLYIGKPDDTGEYPVLLLDTDDIPYICVQYPGIDVYLGLHAGVIQERGGVYGSLAQDRRYKNRMAQHARQTLAGRDGFELEADVCFDDEGFPIEYLHGVPEDKLPPDAVATQDHRGGGAAYVRRLPLG